MAEKKGYWA
jgi:hypothetical protein